MPRIDLKEQPICITGASSGIGAATARACARAGMPVMLGARRVDRLEKLANEIRSAGGRAEFRACDVTDPHSCLELVEECDRAFGSIYAVFANAGYGFVKPFHETTDEELRAIFETNFWGTTNIIRPALDHMLPAKRGHILICSSCLGRFSVPFSGHYCATKAAQLHMGTAMRHELHPLGIHVSTVHPIGTKTEFFEVSESIGGREDPVVKKVPSLFMQPPERVAMAVVRCLHRPKGEIWTSLTIRALAAGITLCPGAGDWALRRRLAMKGGGNSGDQHEASIDREAGR